VANDEMPVWKKKTV